MKGVLSGGRMVWVDKVPGGNQIGGIMCFTRLDHNVVYQLVCQKLNFTINATSMLCIMVTMSDQCQEGHWFEPQ